MKKKLVALAVLASLAAPAAAASMSVATFVAKADSLKKKGPLALLSGDLKLLMNQVKADSADLRSENEALAAAGKPKAYCTPEKFGMGEGEIVAAMRAVPVQRRSSTSTKAALRDYLARRFPCKS